MKNDINNIDEGIKQYMNSLKKFKPLTKQEEHDLIDSYRKHNDIAARNKLITANLKYACKIASEYRGKGLSFNDLISEANDGLMHAIDVFDNTRDIKFYSYAKWWVIQRIQAAIDEKFKNLCEDLPQPYEAQTLDEDDIVINEQVTDNLFIDEVFNYERIDKKEMISILLNVLNDREREIVKMYYGIDYNENYNLEEIGKYFGLTKERIRQIIEKSFLKLRTEALINKNIEK